MRIDPRLLAAAALAAGLAGCELVTVEPAARRIRAPIAVPSWRTDIAPILNETCASSGACHGGPTPQLGLDLSAAASYASVTSHVSGCCGPLVIPGDPANSFLVRVMSTNPADRPGFPYRMPLTGSPMPAPVVETIRNWIAQGAADN